MKHKKSKSFHPLKVQTGIEGFDEITNGGLPRGRTTLIEGTVGSGKTIMALQSLVNCSVTHNEPGIFVAFEENSERITANASLFGWNLQELQKRKLFFLNAQPTPDLFQSGSFDLGGLLAVLDAKIKQMKARCIVFDAIDIILALLESPAAQRREVYRLHDWLLSRGLTAIITSKVRQAAGDDESYLQLGFMQFMVDCALTLNQEVIQGISQRSLRVVKYRGTSFSENEAPFVIGEHGIEVAAPRQMDREGPPVSTKRVSSGLKRLDTMLGGGYYRGASVLITGFPGTAKSTLSGAFAEAACKRGERTLFISFDSDANDIIRNLASVNIRLDRFCKKGLLKLVSARAISGNAEMHLMQIKRMAVEQRARCLVIDPISALSKSGNEKSAVSVAERLIDWTKTTGITVVCTSLLENSGPQVESTPLQISTIADTWIHLNYLVQAGERNRGLSIVKSRGTFHSNQVRELILSRKGVTMADVYTAGGEVLMGTMRWEKERAGSSEREEARLSARQKEYALALEETELESRLKAIQIELAAKKETRQRVHRMAEQNLLRSKLGNERLRELRGMDVS